MTKQVLAPENKNQATRAWRLCPMRNSTQAVAMSAVEVLPLSNGWKVEWSKKLETITPAWDKLPATENVFLTSAYFRMVQQLGLSSLEQNWAIFRHSSGEQFGMVLENFRFNPEEQLRMVAEGDSPSLWQRLLTYLRILLYKLLKFNILTAGQMLLTGQHALRGDFPKDEHVCHQLVAEGVEAIAKSQPQSIHGVMLKDLPLGDAPANDRFYVLPVQPNMILHLQPAWQNVDDYLSAMSSKYRVRAKRARKKGNALERREMGLDEVVAREKEMFAYYEGIAQQADFNLAVLPENYFTLWKTNFPHRFRVWGYFLDSEFIGFSTTIKNGPELEAHFLGFDQRYNRSHQLYLNILYDMVEVALAGEYEQLVYSRTAMEIKSSVGAAPEELKCWLHSRVRIADPLVPIVAQFIAPLPDWVQRKPFK